MALRRRHVLDGHRGVQPVPVQRRRPQRGAAERGEQGVGLVEVRSEPVRLAEPGRGHRAFPEVGQRVEIDRMLDERAAGAVATPRPAPRCRCPAGPARSPAPRPPAPRGVRGGRRSASSSRRARSSRPRLIATQACSSRCRSNAARPAVPSDGRPPQRRLRHRQLAALHGDERGERGRGVGQQRAWPRPARAARRRGPAGRARRRPEPVTAASIPPAISVAAPASSVDGPAAREPAASSARASSSAPVPISAGTASTACAGGRKR